MLCRSTMDVLRAALQEEVRQATVLAEKQKEEMKAAVDTLNEVSCGYTDKPLSARLTSLVQGRHGVSRLRS